MTSEEIIEGLKLLEDNMVYFDELQNDKGKWIDVHELLFESIEALEQEPKTDVLEKIKEEIKDNTYFINETTEKEGIDFETVEKIINKYKAESEDKE